MEIKGKLIKIFDTQTFDSGFKKREFVVNTHHEQYPQDIKLELFNDKCDLIETYNVGDEVKIDFNIRGNEYNGKYFVNLQAWKIEKSSADGGTELYANAAPPPGATDAPSATEDDDDLPF